MDKAQIAAVHFLAMTILWSSNVGSMTLGVLWVISLGIFSYAAGSKKHSGESIEKGGE